MTHRSTIVSSSRLLPFTVAALSLGLGACSFSFKAGGGTSGEAGKTTKPGVQEPAEGTQPAGKPIAGKPVAGSEPAAEGTQPTEPSSESTPIVETVVATTPPEPPPSVAPMPSAICRVEGEGLLDLCRLALDPVAADNFAAWEPHLASEVMVIRPSHDGHQRVRGIDDVRDATTEVGGLRSLLHLHATDRVVATMHNDCRSCRRAFVSFETNTRSGTTVVTVDMTQPPRISMVEIGSRVQRRQLREVRRPMVTKPGPGIEPTPVPNDPPADDSADKPKTEIKATPKVEAKDRKKSVKPASKTVSAKKSR